MRILIDRKLMFFYLTMGVVMFLIGVIDLAGSYPGKLHLVFLNNLWFAVYIMAVNYIVFENSWPFVLKKRKKIFTAIFWILGVIIIQLFFYSIGLYAWRLLGIKLHIFTELKKEATIYGTLENLMVYSAGSFFIFGVSRHIYSFIKLKQATQQLRIEKQEAELNYLKSQTNPHFLFNTLNNIYVLARDKSDLAPESILKLSKILRFMLYETGGEYISIEDELKIMTDYIALEKLRYDESLTVQFSYDIDDMKQAIPPLLLIPLVENAFKHGVSETRNKPFVEIHFKVTEKKLQFLVKNSADFSSERKIKENIGLSNLRRQLELLYLDYNLTLKQQPDHFIANLKINLSSHV